MKSRQALFGSAATFAFSSALSLAALGVDHASAATPADPAAVDLAPAEALNAATAVEDLLVTARRRSEDVQNVPVAITVLGGAALQRADQIRTANDITSYVPNASASATDGRTRPRWFLRGVGTNDTGANTVSPIGIYNDDVYINNVYLQGFPLFDIDHVEVLRGPQGTLWGKNTTGGAVHVISRRPDLDDVNGWIKLGYGDYDSVLAQGAVNIPLVKDKLAARLSASHDERDGHVTNLYDGGKRGGYEDEAIRLLVRAQPAEALDLTLNVHARTLRGDKRVSNYYPDLQQAPPYNSGYVDPPGRDTINQAENAVENLDSVGGSFIANWSLGDYTLTSITAYEEGQRLLTGGAAIPVPNALTYATSDAQQASQELRLSSPKDQPLSWIVGAYLFDEDLRAASSDGVVADIPTNVVGRKPRAYHTAAYTQDTRAYALFASGTYQINDRFNLTGGLRWSLEKKSMHLRDLTATGPVTFSDPSRWYLPEAVNAPLRVNYDQTESDEWREVTYDITPQVKLNDHVSGYFRFAHGFRAGGFAVSGQNTINPIDPEVLDSYETGLKSEWLDRKLILNAAAFYYDYSDIQVLVYAQVAGSPDPVATLQNAGAGWVKGFELEAIARPVDGLRLSGALGLLKTEYTQFLTVVSNAPKDASGNAFARAPHLTASLTAEYVFPAFGGEVALGGDWSYRTRQYFNAAIQDNRLLEQKAYGLANVRAAFSPRGGAWEFAVSVQNVADSDYTVLATGPINKAVRRVSGEPRLALATVTRRF